MFSLISTLNRAFLTSSLNSNRRPSRRLDVRNRAGERFHWERLEDRRLLASASIEGDVLTITGDDNVHDLIQVMSIDGVQAVVSIENRVTGNLTFSGQFPLDQFNSIVIYGYGGHDQIYQSLNKPSRIYGGNGNDVIYGNEADDMIFGEMGNDRLYGFGGNDSIFGAVGHDTLDGGNGVDSLYGDLGNDSLRGGSGIDYLWGQKGDDTYYFSGNNLGNDYLTELAYEGRDMLHFGSMSARVELNLATTANQTVSLWNGAPALRLQLTQNSTVENVVGSNFDDNLFGNSLVNSLSGGIGNDVLVGDTGGDTLDGGTGNDWLSGGADSDTYRFGFQVGPLGNDTIYENANVDSDTLDFSQFRQAVGIDLGMNWSTPAARTIATKNLTLLISNNTAIENVIGTEYSDSIYGNSRANSLRGLSGNDVLQSGAENDFLEGGAGNDILRGGSAADFYVFGAESQLGTDTLEESNVGNGLMFTNFSQGIYVNLGLTSYTVASNLLLVMNDPNDFTNVLGSQFDDIIFGNSRDNVITGSGGSDKLFGMAGRDTLFGDQGNDLLAGGSGDDFLWGSFGDDQLIGDEGNDILYGNGGLDRLYGSEGNDRLDGGDDDLADVLVGGTGADTFVAEWEFRRTNRDRPADFNLLQGDSVV
jgi:Ca2+-binding RTX toxin-like protein